MASLKRKIPKSLKRHWLPLTFLAAILVAVLGFLVYAGSPSVGTVHPAYGIDTPTKAAPSIETTNNLKGKSVTFDYPAVYASAPAQKLAGTQLEIFTFIKKPTPFWFMNTQVSSLPTGKVADDGSYNMRILNPSRFKRELWEVDGHKYEVFSDQSDGYAKAVFVPHGTKLFTVALTSIDTPNSGKLDESLRVVLKSLQWVE